MAKGEQQPEPNLKDNGLANRTRWATRKLTIKSSSNKRVSIIDRLHKRTASTEKKRQSGMSHTTLGDGQESTVVGGSRGEDSASQNPDTEAEEDNGRRIFFNKPLPDDMKDEEGHPIAVYTRNKIRTAKYTPLSFVPKNLWFQFHNLANIFFLFMVILIVSWLHRRHYLIAKPCANFLSDFPYLWWLQSRIERCTNYFHHRCYRYQGCGRGLPPDNHRPGAQQCPGASTGGMGQCECGGG